MPKHRSVKKDDVVHKSFIVVVSGLDNETTEESLQWALKGNLKDGYEVIVQSLGDVNILK